MKTLKSNKYYIRTCWRYMRLIAPKDYNTVDEIEAAASVLKIFEETIPDMVEMQEKIDLTQEKINFKELDTSKEENMKVIQEMNRISRETNISDKKKNITIQLENEEFRTLFEKFNILGKLWFSKVQEFVEFRKQLNTANSSSNKK